MRVACHCAQCRLLIAWSNVVPHTSGTGSLSFFSEITTPPQTRAEAPRGLAHFYIPIRLRFRAFIRNSEGGPLTEVLGKLHRDLSESTRCLTGGLG